MNFINRIINFNFTLSRILSKYVFCRFCFSIQHSHFGIINRLPSTAIGLTSEDGKMTDISPFWKLRMYSTISRFFSPHTYRILKRSMIYILRRVRSYIFLSVIYNRALPDIAIQYTGGSYKTEGNCGAEYKLEPCWSFVIGQFWIYVPTCTSCCIPWLCSLSALVNGRFEKHFLPCNSIW